MATKPKAPAKRAAPARRVSAAEPAPVPQSVALLGPSADASLMWLDTNTQLVNNWLEWQNALWQPWLDWQSAVTRQLGGAWLTPGMTPWLIRGTEQLA